MLQAYKKYWTKYAAFEGKSTRADFWWVVLCNFLVSLPFTIIFFGIYITKIVGLVASHPELFETPEAIDYMSSQEIMTLFLDVFSGLVPLLIIGLIWWLATLLPNLALEVRRYRDAGFSWALIFLNLGAFLSLLVPGLGAFISLGFHIARLVLLVQPSKGETEVNSEIV